MSQGSRPLAILGLPGSGLAARVAHQIRSICRTPPEVAILDLDAPLNGRLVSLDADQVLWQGFDLLQAGAALLERPVFPWPQPQTIIADSADPAAMIDDRRARSLALAAILTVASVRPVINPPAAAHLAISPTAALDRLAQSGFEVRPWTLAPAPAQPRAAVRDAAGRDRWHCPEPPITGQPAVRHEADGDGAGIEVVDMLVIGESAIGWAGPGDRTAYQSIDRADTAGGESVAGLGPEVTARARAATASLGLDLAVVSLTPEQQPRIVWVDAGPRLEQWEQRLDGEVSRALAAHLISRADEEAR